MMMFRVAEIVAEPMGQLGGVDKNAFVDAWRKAHHAAQAAVELGKGWAEPRDDDSHSAMMFLPETGGFASLVEDRVACSLEMHAASLAVLTQDSEEGEVLPLEGKTVAEAADWVRAKAEALLGPARQASKPAPDLPNHPVGKGKPITIENEEAWDELTRHYWMTIQLLEAMVEELTGEADDGEHELVPRLWPHHFDLASLYVLDRDKKGEIIKSIGVGLTPPDKLSKLGYWYVSPWRKSGEGEAIEDLPDLPWGKWHDRGGSAMAILPVSEVWDIAKRYDDEDAEEEPAAIPQMVAVSEFVAQAFDACFDDLEDD